MWIVVNSKYFVKFGVLLDEKWKTTYENTISEITNN